MNHPFLRTSLEQLPEEAFIGDGISFRPIRTDADLAYAIFDCQLNEEQWDFVNPAGFSIGRAYLHPENHFPCLILNENNQPVGFIDLDMWLGQGTAFHWSYYIDREQQGRGYGRKAAQLAVRIFKSVDPDMSIKLSTEADNLKAQRLYLSLGFQKLEEMDGDDLVFGM